MLKQETCKRGRLYIVATPIGNLEDITLRAIRVLSESDLILAEDTRKTKKLLTHYKIRHAKLESCHAYNEAYKVQDILRQLNEDKNIAIVSESGTPGISDPGESIAKRALSIGHKVIPIPGPSALTACISISGAPSNKIFFAGFLPRVKSRRMKELLFIKNLNLTTLLYESPKRVTKTLKDISNFMPAREVFIAKEMTKIHEETFLGLPEKLIKTIGHEKLRGEFSLLILPGETRQVFNEAACLTKANTLMKKLKLSANDAARLLSLESGIPKKNIYKLILNAKKRNQYLD